MYVKYVTGIVIRELQTWCC